MSRPRFLADHDLNENILHGVWRHEPTIVFRSAREFQLEQRPDDELLAFAAARGLIAVSHDVNTMRAAALARIDRGEPFSGLIMIHQRAPLANTIEDLVLIWAASEAEEWVNEVQFLPL
jgi:hypothetical protein